MYGIFLTTLFLITGLSAYGGTAASSAADSLLQNGTELRYRSVPPCPGILFDAGFESGSLDSVRYAGSRAITNGHNDTLLFYEYDVYSRPDPANPADPELAPSARWYYFRITGVRDKNLILHFHRSDAQRPFYSYDNVSFLRFPAREAPDGKSICKRFENDTVYIAYFSPYTESRLKRRIEEWSSRPCVQVNGIGTSEHGREMPLLTITEPGVRPGEKKRVYIHGRIHPSEAPASWHLDHLIELLTDDAPYARALRRNAVFYILPFANPDGVAEGMSRSNGKGINLEINWDKSEDLTAKEVLNIRSFLEEITRKRPLDLVLNMHSQSNSCITYWIHKPGPTSGRYYRNLMLLAHLTLSGNPFFAPEDLSYSAGGSRYLEGWLWNRHREQTTAVTFETPYTYYRNDPGGDWVTLENLRQTAEYSLLAIGDYLGIADENRIPILSPRRSPGTVRRTDDGHIYFGREYRSARKDGARALYKFRRVLPGRYRIYKWEPGSSDPQKNRAGNRWVAAGEKIHRGGKFKYRLPLQAGEKANALLLLRAAEDPERDNRNSK